jgi:hypothetical protein
LATATMEAKAPDRRSSPEAVSYRAEGKIIRDYLNALDARAELDGRRGPRITPERIQGKIDSINEQLVHAKGVNKLQLVQAKLNLERQLGDLDSSEDLEDLEEQFTAVVARWAERKGISYSALRAVGVPAAVLRTAGVTETRRRT